LILCETAALGCYCASIFGEFGLADTKAANESQGFCCYIIVIVGKQVVYIPADKQSSTKKILQTKKAN